MFCNHHNHITEVIVSLSSYFYFEFSLTSRAQACLENLKIIVKNHGGTEATHIKRAAAVVIVLVCITNLQRMSKGRDKVDLCYKTRRAYTVQNGLLDSQYHDDIIRNQEILAVKMT